MPAGKSRREGLEFEGNSGTKVDALEAGLCGHHRYVVGLGEALLEAAFNEGGEVGGQVEFNAQAANGGRVKALVVDRVQVNVGGHQVELDDGLGGGADVAARGVAKAAAGEGVGLNDALGGQGGLKEQRYVDVGEARLRAGTEGKIDAKDFLVG